MRLLVTGSTGQLARSLVERALEVSDVAVEAVGRPELDLEQPGSAARHILAARPDVVVNAAAYTAVDLAEREPERAFRINGAGAGEVAAAAREIGAPIIHISTDYVFDGSGHKPWKPTDQTAPLGVYGASKLEGEEQVRAANPQHLIVRTAWVFSPFGRNFVGTMLRLAGEREEVSVVADQRGCPTNALDLADAILAVAERWRARARTGLGETMHVVGAGACSWADFATATFDAGAAVGGPAARVVPITSADYPTSAKRPANSVLDCSDFERAFGWPMRPWAKGLPAVVERMLAKR